MESNRDEPERIGKFSSPRDEVLNTLALDGWANESSGEAEAPCGWFARISNTESELEEVVQAFEAEIANAGLTDRAQLIGHFLLVETETGFVHVSAYDDEEKLKYDYARLEEVYRDWSAESQS